MAAPLIRSFLGKQFKFSNIFLNIQRNVSHNVNSILTEKPIGNAASVKGWVRGIQKHKDLTFLHLTDGSGPRHLQVVVPESLANTLAVTYGSCVHVDGVVTKSHGKGQDVEMVLSDVKIIGSCNSVEFPFKQRHRHPPQYAHDFLHLRPKTRLFNSLLRIRNDASMAVHQYFQKEKYIFIHTPVLTANDCEGACEVFQVEPLKPLVPGSDSEEWEGESSGTDAQQEASDSESSDDRPSQFFRRPAYLTVSGQLHLEVMTGAMTKVYNFGPVFRAEKSGGRFHLSEFSMIEAELAFTETLEDILVVMESLVKHVYQAVMDSCPEDVDLYSKSVAPPSFQKTVEKMMQSEFKRISYTDAVELLLNSNQDFKTKVKWGNNLMKEHETYLTQALGNIPVFVTDYPTSSKPFYAKWNPDSSTVAASDLLVPHVGELCGSSLREDRLDVLTNVMDSQGLTEQMDWYLDLRRFGSCPHGGFGLGFERLLLFMLGAPGVKDVVPFPRWPGRCDL